jgi:hypothetical protein
MHGETVELVPRGISVKILATFLVLTIEAIIVTDPSLLDRHSDINYL